MRRTIATANSFAARVHISHQGCPRLGPQLADALQLQWRHGFPTMPRGMDGYTSGFHPLLAGMNPAVARALLPLLGLGRGQRVLDPFVGSGTVLVEAAAAGLEGLGVDISPLAAFIATHHAWTEGTAADRLFLVSSARVVADRVATSASALPNAAQPNAAQEAAQPGEGGPWCGPGGVDSLRNWGPVAHALHGASAELPEAHVLRLWFCYSAAVARGAGGHKSKLVRSPSAAATAFVGAVEEYTQRAERLSAACAAAGDLGPYHGPGGGTGEGLSRRGGSVSVVPRVVLGDARSALARDAGGLFDGLLTSPPYPGVYDYVAHAREHRERLTRHANTHGAAMAQVPIAPLRDGAAESARAAFLTTNVPAKGSREWGPLFDSRGEVGSHKAAKRLLRPNPHSSSSSSSSADGKGGALAAAWAAEETAWMSSAGAVLRPGALAVLLVGDGVDDSVDGLAAAAASAASTSLFEVVASASIRSASSSHRGAGARGGARDEARDAGKDAPGPPPGNRRAEHFVMLRRV